jgi:predicted HTH domain antitoxin
LLHLFYQFPRFALVGQARSPLSDEEKREDERQAIALNLLRENISLGTIARITGLTISQLQQLQSEQQ